MFFCIALIRLLSKQLSDYLIYQLHWKKNVHRYAVRGEKKRERLIDRYIKIDREGKERERKRDIEQERKRERERDRKRER